jgi:hypothetical protein
VTLPCQPLSSYFPLFMRKVRIFQMNHTKKQIFIPHLGISESGLLPFFVVRDVIKRQDDKAGLSDADKITVFDLP